MVPLLLLVLRRLSEAESGTTTLFLFRVVFGLKGILLFDTWFDAFLFAGSFFFGHCFASEYFGYLDGLQLGSSNQKKIIFFLT